MDIIKSRFSKRVSYTFLFFIFIFFYIYRLFFYSSGILETISSYVIYPVLVLQKNISDPIKSFFQEREESAKLKFELQQIQKNCEDLMSENIQIKSSLRYLEEIQELIEFKKRYNLENFMIAEILLKQIAQEGNFLFIDKGLSSGIKQDMIVVYKNCLIGKVKESYPTYSKVLSITDPSCKIAACCVRSGSTGIYEGSNQIDKSKLCHVSHLETIYEDDLVISSGEGLIFPKGFALGKISKFSKDNIQYQIDLKPVLDLNKISSCFIIMK